MKKVLCIALALGLASCARERRMEDIIVKRPRDFLRLGRCAYVLDYDRNNNYDGLLLTFIDGKPVKKRPFPEGFNGAFICYLNGKLFSTDYKYFTMLSVEDFTRTFSRLNDFVIGDIAPWRADSLLVLGKKEGEAGKVFHVFDQEGSYQRSFGVFPERLHQNHRVFPLHFWVVEDTIYVTGVTTCNIYKYVERELRQTITWPDSTYRDGFICEDRGKVDVVYAMNGVSGLAVWKGLLYATAYKHGSTGPMYKRKTDFSIRAYDLRQGVWLYKEKTNTILSLLYADEDGLYFTVGDERIKQWRGIYDTPITQQ